MKPLLAVYGIGLAAAASLAHAQTAAPVQAQAFVPGLGEIMTLQQSRHAKLWLAGRNGNWPLADYELDELKEGFEDAAKFNPVHEGTPVGAMIANLTPAPLDAIGKAIASKNKADFAKSFDRLTAVCNTCHKAAKHPFIVIIRPGESTFRNQDFAPGKQ